MLEVIIIIDELVMYGFLVYDVIFNDLTIANFVFMLAAIRKFTSSIAELIDNYSTIIACKLKTIYYINFHKLNLHRKYEIDVFNEEFEYLEFKNVFLVLCARGLCS